MFDLFFAISLLGSCCQVLKEKSEPIIPADNWANSDLLFQDRMNGVAEEQILTNIHNGRYKQTKTYAKPHRDVDGRIIIENNKLYDDDLKNYGAKQTYKWVEQGKYNLSRAELKKENKRVQKEIEYLYSLL